MKMDMKRAKNTQTQKVSKIGLNFRKLKLRKIEEKRKYTVPQGGRMNNQGENNKHKGGREGRKMQKEENQENQEVVIEIETGQETTHASND